MYIYLTCLVRFVNYSVLSLFLQLIKNINTQQQTRFVFFASLGRRHNELAIHCRRQLDRELCARTKKTRHNSDRETEKLSIHIFIYFYI